MGFFSTLLALVVALGLALALPRLVHGGGLRRPGALPRVHRAPDLPGARHESRARADLEALRRLAGHLLGGLHCVHLRDPSHSGVAAPQSPAPGRRRLRRSASTRRSRFVTNTNWQNYGGETTMSYFSQIGALTVQQFVIAGRRHRGRDRDGARLRSAQLGDDRQLLGRHHALHALHPVADRLRRRASSSSARVRSRRSPARSPSTTR